MVFSLHFVVIPPAILVEILAYSFITLAVFVCGLELKTRHLYHCTYRLFTLSVLLHWSGVMMNAVTWAKYAVSGIGPFTVFGGLFTGAGEIAFLLLMLLMAKGYTITRARLSTPSTVKITIFINLYVVVYITLYIYQAEVSAEIRHCVERFSKISFILGLRPWRRTESVRVGCGLRIGGAALLRLGLLYGVVYDNNEKVPRETQLLFSIRRARLNVDNVGSAVGLSDCWPARSVGELAGRMLFFVFGS